MIVKIFKAVWFLSLLVTLMAFLYIYASLPENVALFANKAVVLSREGFFYSALTVVTVFNVLVFIVNRLFRARSEHFVGWFYGLIGCLNFFLIVVLGFLNLYNGDERFDFSRLGFLIYGSIALVVAWMVSWPFVLLYRRFMIEKTV